MLSPRDLPRELSIRHAVRWAGPMGCVYVATYEVYLAGVDGRIQSTKKAIAHLLDLCYRTSDCCRGTVASYSRSLRPMDAFDGDATLSITTRSTIGEGFHQPSAFVGINGVQPCYECASGS